MLLEVDPNSVVAGWLPLLLVVGIGVLIALMYLSMRRHVGRIDIPTQAELVRPQAAAPDAAERAEKDVAAAR